MKGQDGDAMRASKNQVPYHNCAGTHRTTLFSCASCVGCVAIGTCQSRREWRQHYSVQLISRVPDLWIHLCEYFHTQIMVHPSLPHVSSRDKALAEPSSFVEVHPGGAFARTNEGKITPLAIAGATGT